MTKREMMKELRSYIPQMEMVTGIDRGTKKSFYLGSFMSLDPCGRYHHILSPNGLTSKCEGYWERLDAAAEAVGGWIESGEGDPCDIYFCMPAEEK